MTDSSMLPPAAWYADPQDPAGLRYWDGAQWTDQTRPMVIEPVAPQPVVEPVPPVAPQPVAVEPVEPVAAVQETVGFAPEADQFRVTETVVDQSIAYQPAAVEPVAMEPEPAVVVPEQELYPGFAAEVAALQAQNNEVASVAEPAAAPAEAGAVVEPTVQAEAIVVTTDSVPGRRIVSAVGTAVGVAVVAQSQLVGADPAVVLQQARRDALARLAADAAASGATAVVGVRLEPRTMGELTEIAAHGTAVVTEQG